jgi:hypothetical protein
VTPLADFTWGLDFKYIGPIGKIVGFTNDDYAVTAKPLAFGNVVSDTFKGAFDRKGVNADVEWQVNFIDPPGANVPAVTVPVVNVPTPTTPAPSPQPNIPIANIPESSSVPGTLIAGALGIIALHQKQQQTSRTESNGSSFTARGDS